MLSKDRYNELADMFWENIEDSTDGHKAAIQHVLNNMKEFKIKKALESLFVDLDDSELEQVAFEFVGYNEDETRKAMNDGR